MKNGAPLVVQNAAPETRKISSSKITTQGAIEQEQPLRVENSSDSKVPEIVPLKGTWQYRKRRLSF